MNKTELISVIAEDCGLTKKDTEKVLNTFMKVVGECLKRREKVNLMGFGTFEARKRKARIGRNPRKPEQRIEIPSTITPIFRVGKTLKEKVAGQK
jgi:DNA-binding protein HU-beta